MVIIPGIQGFQWYTLLVLSNFLECTFRGTYFTWWRNLQPKSLICVQTQSSGFIGVSGQFCLINECTGYVFYVFEVVICFSLRVYTKQNIVVNTILGESVAKKKIKHGELTQFLLLLNGIVTHQFTKSRSQHHLQQVPSIAQVER